MSHIVLDSSLLAKLEEAGRPLDLCDGSGRILGTFYPRSIPTRIDYEAVERARPKLSEEELRKRENGPTYTTAEVIKYLESL